MNPKNDVKSELLKDFKLPYIHDSKVECVICGASMQLSKLIDHQKSCHSTTLKKHLPSTSTKPVRAGHIRCIFCAHDILKDVMSRHLARKHKGELQKKSSLRMNAGTQTDTPILAIPVPKENVEMDAKAEVTPDAGSTQKVSKVMSVDASKPMERPKKYALSLERDEDGFLDLVLTIQ